MYEFNTKGHKNDAEVLIRDKIKRKNHVTNGVIQQWYIIRIYLLENYANLCNLCKNILRISFGK